MSAGLKDQQADKRLEKLRQILLAQDRESQASVMERLSELESALVDDEAFEARLSPHLKEQVAYLQEHFPQLFGKFMGPAIRKQIEEEREVIIDALYPIIGRLIARYLKEEIQRISDRIDDSLKDPFSLENLKLRIQALFSHVSYQELLFQQMARQNRLEEVFIIQKDSGLALGHYSLNEVTRSQMVAGMLTGIKNFLEDAFQKGGQELDTLEYEDYQIKIFSYNRFYFAAVIKGMPDSRYEQFLRKYVDAFCEKTTIPSATDVTNSLQERLSEELKQHFDAFNQSGDQ